MPLHRVSCCPICPHWAANYFSDPGLVLILEVGSNDWIAAVVVVVANENMAVGWDIEIAAGVEIVHCHCDWSCSCHTSNFQWCSSVAVACTQTVVAAAVAENYHVMHRAY